MGYRTNFGSKNGEYRTELTSFDNNLISLYNENLEKTYKSRSIRPVGLIETEGWPGEPKKMKKIPVGEAIPNIRELKLAAKAVKGSYKMVNNRLEREGVETLDEPKNGIYVSNDHSKQILMLDTPFGAIPLPLPGGGLGYNNIEKDRICLSEDIIPGTEGFIKTWKIIKGYKRVVGSLLESGLADDKIKPLLKYILHAYNKEDKKMEYLAKHPEYAIKEIEKVSTHELYHSAGNKTGLIEYLFKKYADYLKVVPEDVVKIIEQNAIDLTSSTYGVFTTEGEYRKYEKDFDKRSKKTGISGASLLRSAAHGDPGSLNYKTNRLYPELREKRMLELRAA
jgi:hypothetical protein